MKSKYLYALIGLMVVLSMVLSACGTKTSKIITIAWTQEPNTLNRNYSTMWFMSVITNIYGCWPWNYDENNVPYPYMLTELPTASADGKTVTMHLRDDLVWSDNQPLTADDFVFSWEMVMDPGNSVSSQYPYDQLESITATDSQTVVMQFADVFTPWLNTFWQGTLMPKHVLQPVFDAEGSIDAAAWNTAPTVGCGPFTFTEWQSGGFIRFDRNENYWGTKPKLDAVIFQIVPDDAASTAACLAGDADICYWPPYSDIPVFQDEGMAVITEPAGYNEGWFFNLRDMASIGVRDLNVRKAIAMALDRTSNTILRENVVKVNETFWDSIPDYVDPTIVPWTYDPDAARALLEASGWIDRDDDGIRENADGIKLTITQANTDKTERQNYQALAQQQLLAVGIDLQTSSMDSAILFDSFSADGPMAVGSVDIGQWSDVPYFPDPDTSYWLCADIPTADNPWGLNYYTCDPTLDALFQEQVSTVDPEARKAIFHQITKYMHDNVYYLGIWEDPDVWIISPHLTADKFSGVTPFFDISAWDLVP